MDHLEPNKDAVDAELEPKPMCSRPALQALFWAGGVAAGGLVFASLLTLTPTRARGATCGGAAKWAKMQGQAAAQAQAARVAQLVANDHQHSDTVEPSEQFDSISRATTP